MNDQPKAPFAFAPATPKGAENQLLTYRDEDYIADIPQSGAAPKRARRTKAELAAAQGEKQVDPFDVFDRVHGMLDSLPKPVRDRIMSTLNRIYS